MERIYYSNDTLLTGSELAQALLSYANALAKRGSSATAQVPVRHPDGSTGRATLLIGPASQLVCETVDDVPGMPELVDDEAVAGFLREVARLDSGPAESISSTDAPRSTSPDFE